MFPIYLRTIKKYQRKKPSLIAKYQMGRYQQSSFCGGSIIQLKLITCKYKVVIPLIIQG